jgi:hypothetical protein
MAVNFSLPNGAFRLTPEDMGVTDIGKALRSGFDTYSKGYEAAYKPKNLQTALLDAQLKNAHDRTINKYLDRSEQARIGSQESAAGLHRAQLQRALSDMNFLSQFNGGSQNSTPTSPPADVNEGYDNKDYNVSADGPGRAASTSAYDTFPGRRPAAVGASQENAPSSPEGFSEAPSSQPALYGNVSQGLSNPTPRLSNGMSYADASRAAQILKLPAFPVKDIDGKITAITPWGNIQVAEGPNALKKAISTNDAKVLADLEKTVLNSSSGLSNMENITGLLVNPVFQEMRQNPALGKHELRWFSKFGTPEQQQLVGNFKAYTGEVIKNASRDFAGAFRQGEQGLLEGMKPSDSDSLDVMKGKTEALTTMLTLISKRAEIEANAMRERGFSPVKAKQFADLLIDRKAIIKQVHDKLNPEKKWQHLSDDELLQRMRGAPK